MTKFKLNQSMIFYLLFPFIFSIFSSLLYLFAYKPEYNSLGMTNVLMVFFAAFGWSSVIFFGERKLLVYSYFYSVIAIGTPIILFEILRVLPYDVHWHRIILAIIISSDLWLIDIYKGKSVGKSCSGE